MDTPRILAIGDVHLFATRETADAVVAFYTNLIGLDNMGGGTADEPVRFRGYPRSGPKLVVRLGDAPAPDTLRRQVLIQVACLTRCAEEMAKFAATCFWMRGWTPYDRRLTLFDPAGNRVGLVAYHAF